MAKKRDKTRELEERLDRIERDLAISDRSYGISHAIEQLGGGLGIFTFDPSRQIEDLPLFRVAKIADSNGFYVGEQMPTTRLKNLYEQIKIAFNAYKAEEAKEAASASEIDKLVANAPVDDKMERIEHDGWYNCLYRTEETRRFDEEFRQVIGERRLLGLSRVLDIDTSDPMDVFVDIVNERGYFAGISLDELRLETRAFLTSSDLEQHIKDGFIALKRCQEDQAVVAVPLKFPGPSPYSSLSVPATSVFST